MPTLKQRKAVERIVENRGNVSRSMIEVGYSENSAKNPSNLTESKGFRELCEEYGLTEQLLTKALVEDIVEKKGNRKAELELGYKVLGRLKETPDRQINNLFVVSNEQAARIAARFAGRDTGDGETSGEE